MDWVFMRFKDLKAYSQEHAEIMDQREGMELLGLGTFLGMSNNPHLRDNQQHLRLLTEEALANEGRKENSAADIRSREEGRADSQGG